MTVVSRAPVARFREMPATVRVVASGDSSARQGARTLGWVGVASGPRVGSPLLYPYLLHRALDRLWGRSQGYYKFAKVRPCNRASMTVTCRHLRPGSTRAGPPSTALRPMLHVLLHPPPLPRGRDVERLLKPKRSGRVLVRLVAMGAFCTNLTLSPG